MPLSLSLSLLFIKNRGTNEKTSSQNPLNRRQRRHSAPKDERERETKTTQCSKREDRDPFHSLPKEKKKKKISGMDGCNGDSGMDSECNRSIYWGWKDAVFLGFWHFCFCVSVTEKTREQEIEEKNE